MRLINEEEILKGIEELKESPWFHSEIAQTGNLAEIIRKDCMEVIISLCIEKIKTIESDKWIPVAERLPECEEEVWIQTKKGTQTTAMYEDGKMDNNDSGWSWTDIDFVYNEETDTEYIPEGWWEYRHFNPDDVYNNLVDEEVIAWHPLPESYKPEGEKE